MSLWRPRFALALPLALGLAAGPLAVGCNSDQLLTSGIDESSTGPDKTPMTTLPETTQGVGESSSTGTPADLIPCRQIVECLATCKLVPTTEIDQACVLGCAGVEGITAEELLWTLDLGLCVADLCAMEELPGGGGGTDTDGGPNKCNPDPVIGLDFGEDCLACIVVKLISETPLEGCEEQFANCDNDPLNDPLPGVPRIPR